MFTATGPDGSPLAALVAAMLWTAILAGRWHEAKGHAHQADAARATVQHLQAAADQALAPVLTELTTRRPGETARRTLARAVRAALPADADRILADTGWPALAALLTDAETRGHQPHQLLTEAAARRELTTARQPAHVLLTRIQHTARNPAPNRRAAAARLRSTTNPSNPGGEPQLTPTLPTPPPVRLAERRQR